MSNKSNKLKINVNDLCSEIYNNALIDREKALDLFEELSQQLAGQLANHATVGLIIAKYLERLNISNSQLIKLAEMIQHGEIERERIVKHSVSEKDKDSIYEEIKKKFDEQ